MTKIKMCGLRRPEDIEYVNEVMPDYAGFIMSQRFGRSVTPQQQIRLREMLAPGIKAVGVFVDEPVEYAAAIANSGSVDLVQFHGSESDEYIEQFRRLCGATTSVIRAFRIRSAGDLKLALLSTADYILLDSGTGSGICFDWELAGSGISEMHQETSSPEDIHSAFVSEAVGGGIDTPSHEDNHLSAQVTCQTDCISKPIFLAGGLDPDNVAEAINKIHPFAVDVSSGIETGSVKNRSKMIAFAEAVRNAASSRPCQTSQNG